MTINEFPYQSRVDAGRVLAEALASYQGTPGLLVLALPRGGVPVGAEIAAALEAEWDILIVRKLGVPWQKELAMGAIASGGVCLRNENLMRAAGVSEADFERVEELEREELRRRERRYRGERPFPEVRDRVVILVDDGLATGSTMQAAVHALRKLGPRKIVVAVPVGAQDSLLDLERAVDEVVCPAVPHPFRAIGRFYQDFTQVTDEEVCSLLAKNHDRIAVRSVTPGETDAH